MSAGFSSALRIFPEFLKFQDFSQFMSAGFSHAAVMRDIELCKCIGRRKTAATEGNPDFSFISVRCRLKCACGSAGGAYCTFFSRRTRRSCSTSPSHLFFQEDPPQLFNIKAEVTTWKQQHNGLYFAFCAATDVANSSLLDRNGHNFFVNSCCKAVPHHYTTSKLNSTADRVVFTSDVFS